VSLEYAKGDMRMGFSASPHHPTEQLNSDPPLYVFLTATKKEVDMGLGSPILIVGW
jgi:hypothetical protein